MSEPDEALLWARENSPPHIYVDLANAANAYRAGARMAREQERERAKVLVRGLENIVDADQDVISEMALDALAKYRGEA